MSWADTARELDTMAPGSGGDYLRLAPGEKARVVFIGAPHPYLGAWTGESTEIYDPAIHSPDMRRKKAAINVYNVDAGCVQVWEVSGKTLEEELVPVDKKYAAVVPTSVFEVARTTATGKDTRYKVMFDAPQTAEQSEAVANAEPQDLAARYPAPVPF